MGELVVDGVTHRVERVTDPARVAAISACVAGADVLIADGHHRYGVARHYRDEQRAARGGDAGAAELTLFHVAELSPDQLTVQAIHRVYSDVDPAALRAALERCFELTEAPAPSASTAAELAERGPLLLTGTGAWWLTPRPGAFDGVRALDGAWLEHALDGVTHTVEYQHGVERTARRLEEDPDAVAAVLIRPTSVDEIERTAREGLLMPPKSTFFTPKLRTGLVIREITEEEPS